MPLARLELARYCYQRILSPQRLPFRHKGIYGYNTKSNISLLQPQNPHGLDAYFLLAGFAALSIVAGVAVASASKASLSSAGILRKTIRF